MKSPLFPVVIWAVVASTIAPSFGQSTSVQAPAPADPYIHDREVAAQRFEAREFKAADGQVLKYRLLLPKGYRASRKYPVVVFLHGSGERGSDNAKQLFHVAFVFSRDESMKRFPAFVMFPQCPEDSWWGIADKSKHEADKPLDLVIQAEKELEARYAIDPNRRYIGGLSMGGFGTWDALQNYPGYFAAATPICGGGDPKRAYLAANTPVWVFHGGADPVVDPRLGREMVATMLATGGHPRYTEFPGVEHASWVPASEEPDFLPWMFAQRLGRPDHFRQPKPHIPPLQPKTSN